MPEEMSQLLRRLDTTERNQADLARSVTALTDRLEEVGKVVDELRLDRARREERDLRMNERFDRIEKSIEKGFEDVDELFKTLKKPFWIAAGTFITSLAGAFAVFVIRGGLNISP